MCVSDLCEDKFCVSNLCDGQVVWRGGAVRQRRRQAAGYRTKNKNPTQRCVWKKCGEPNFAQRSCPPCPWTRNKVDLVPK